MGAKEGQFNLPGLPVDPLQAGVQAAEAQIDPALTGRIEQVAHAALDQILQWAFKNILPALIQSISAEYGAAQTVAAQGKGVANAVIAQIQNIAQMASNATPGGNIGAQGGPNADAGKFKMGQYPHGDVDLRFMGANVARPVLPKGKSTKREFYFLNDSNTPQQIPKARASAGRPAGTNVADGQPR